MRTKLIIIALFGASTLMTSCDYDNIKVSNDVTTLSYDISDYSRLKISDSFNAFVTFSETEESIEVEANTNLHGHIIISKEGSTLEARLRRFTNLRGNVTLNIYITTSNIEKFKASGASKISLENDLVSDDVLVELSGASSFTGEIHTDRLDVELRGASTMDLFGTADRCHAQLSGSSSLLDYDLSVNDLNIDMAGASDAFLSAMESIDIEAAGASTLYYMGNATIERERLSGASKIVKR